MIERLLIFKKTIQSSISFFGQTSPSASPYIILEHTWNVPASGIYHFNINSVSFSTHVEFGS